MKYDEKVKWFKSICDVEKFAEGFGLTQDKAIECVCGSNYFFNKLYKMIKEENKKKKSIN